MFGSRSDKKKKRTCSDTGVGLERDSASAEASVEVEEEAADDDGGAAEVESAAAAGERWPPFTSS